MENLTDEQLVERYLGGDQASLEALFQRYLKPLYNFIFKYTHTTATAEDVTQDAFVKIWKALPRFDSHYKFKTWAFTIAKNTALDALKKKGLVALPEDGADLPAAFFTNRPLPEEALMLLDDTQMMQRAMVDLPEKYREVISLYYRQGLNFREISELLKISIHTIKTRHRRALVQIREKLGGWTKTALGIVQITVTVALNLWIL